jgi:hypothetical protein
VSTAGDDARAASRLTGVTGVTGALERELVVGLDFTGAGRFFGRPRTSSVRMVCRWRRK